MTDRGEALTDTLVMHPRRTRVSGRYAGPVSRLAAYVVDVALMTITYGLLAAAAAYVVDLLFGAEIDSDDGRWWWLAGWVAWAFLYMWVGLAVAGRTLGKAVAGLKVVSRQGLPLTPRAAFVRVVTFPLSLAVFGLGLIGIVVGRERRALHDVLAGSAVVYDWGDRPAELPAPLTRWLAERGVAAPGEPEPQSSEIRST